MGFFQFFISATVLTCVAGISVIGGIALLIGAFLGRKFRRESRTLARYGVVALLIGVIGTIWPPIIGAGLVVFVVWGLSQCFK